LALFMAGCSLGLGQGGASGGRLGTDLWLGAILPTSGPLMERGLAGEAVLKLLEHEVNAAGGIDGTMLRFAIYNEAAAGATPDPASQAVARLAATDKVLAIVGPYGEEASSKAFAAAQRPGVPIISPVWWKAAGTGPGRPWAFRNAVSEAVMAEKTAATLKRADRPASLAVIYDSDDPASVSLATAVWPAAAINQGLKIAGEPAAFPASQADLSGPVGKIKALNPDAVVVCAPPAQAASVIRELKRQSMDKPVVGGSQLVAGQVLEAARGLTVVAASTYAPGLPGPTAQHFNAAAGQALAQSAKLPSNTTPGAGEAAAYEAAGMLVRAVRDSRVSNRESDLASDRQRISEYLGKLQQYPGLLGPISFKDGDAVKKFVVVTGADGRWTAGDPFCSDPAGC
jgi:branched-chain amino acid transport system substrate-binding protein